MNGKAGSELEIEMGGWWMWLFVFFSWMVGGLAYENGWMVF
jgi:hypothetical protein